MDKLQALLVGTKFSWGNAGMHFLMLNGGSYKGNWLSLGGNSNGHNFLATYDLTNKLKGFYGMPLILNWGSKWNLENKASVSARLSLQDEWIYTE